MDPIQLVGLPHDSRLFAEREQVLLLGELWKRLRNYGHAPILAYLSDQPLEYVKSHLPNLDLEPDFLICDKGKTIYDCAEKREWTELTEQKSPENPVEAFELLEKGLDIESENSLLVGRTASTELIAEQITMPTAS